MQPSPVSYEEDQAESVSPYLLWGVWLMWLFFLIQPVTAMLQLPWSPNKAAQLCAFIVFISIYLRVTWQEAYRLSRVTSGAMKPGLGRWMPLIVMTCLSIILPLVQGDWGLGGFIFTSAANASRLTLRQAVLMVGGLMVLVVIMANIITSPAFVLTSANLSTIAQMFFLIPAVGIIVYYFGSSLATNQELRRARREIARLAVAEERLRFARDLHDLLGHTLSLIALKSELAGQLILESPERAQREVGEIETAARTALQEVREAVAGYRESTLASELQRANEILAAAGIRLSVRDAAGMLPPACETLFAWVVREGVTNVIRHSRAQQCVVAIARGTDAATITITDDGQSDDSHRMIAQDAVANRGNGLRGISERAAALQGCCDAGPLGERGFQLAVSLPLSDDRSSDPVLLQPDAAHEVSR